MTAEKIDKKAVARVRKALERRFRLPRMGVRRPRFVIADGGSVLLVRSDGTWAMLDRGEEASLIGVVGGYNYSALLACSLLARARRITQKDARAFSAWFSQTQETERRERDIARMQAFATQFGFQLVKKARGQR